MTWLALAAEGAAPERFGQVDSVAAAIATIMTAVVTGLVTFWKQRESSKEKVSGDEKEARAEEREDIKAAITRWRDLVDQCNQDLERKDRELAATSADRDRWRRIAEEYERLHEEDRMIRLIHGAWDFTIVEAASRAGVVFSPPPPLLAPRTARES